MRDITLTEVTLGGETYYRLNIGSSITLLTREEAKQLTSQLDINSNSIYEVPF